MLVINNSSLTCGSALNDILTAPKRPKNARKQARGKGKKATLEELPDRVAHSSSGVALTGSASDSITPEN